MALNTTFSGIRENQASKRIDALRDMIGQGLTETLDSLHDLHAETRAVVSWYEENGADLVRNAVTAETPLDRESIESQISITPEDRGNEGASFVRRLSNFMEDRPSFNFWRFVQGEDANNKLAFLDSLAEKGETLLTDAADEKTRMEGVLSETKESQWQGLERAREFYQTLTEAIADRDVGAVVNVMTSDAAKGMQSKIRKDLFLSPVGQYETAMMAVTDIDFSDPRHEGEIVSTILNSFGDDYEALQVIRDTISKIEDTDTKERYEAYAHAFVGMFLPVQDEIININRIGEGYYSGTRLYLQDTRGKGMSPKTMDADQANLILSELASREEFIQIQDEVMNVNHVGKVYYRGGHLHAYDMRGSGRRFEMEESEAEQVIAQFVERPNYMEIDGKALNLNQVASVEYKGAHLYIRGMQRSCVDPIEMDGEEAQAIIAEIAERKNFMDVAGRAVNVNHIGRASYNGALLYLRGMRNYGPEPIEIVEEDAAAVMAEFLERPNFLEVDGTVINANHVGQVKYDGSSLHIKDMRRNGPEPIKMEEAEAKEVIAAFAELSAFVEIGGRAINTNQVGKVQYVRSELSVENMHGYGPDIKMEEADAVEEIHHLGERPSYFVVDDSAANLFHVAKGYYSGKKLHLEDPTGRGLSFEMDKDKATSTLKDIRRVGQRLGIMQAYAGQKEELRFGILQARESEELYRRSNDTSDSFMDNLPIIIVAAMILLDDQPELAQATEASLDTDLGDQAALADATDDFAVAGSMVDDDAIANLGIDAFSADFDATFEHDGMFADYDSGGMEVGGMDVGGIDVTTDIGVSAGSDFSF